MGVFGGLIKVLTGALGGGSKPSTPAPVAAKPAGPSAADIVKEQDEAKRRRLLAMNSGTTGSGQMTPAGGAAGAAPVFRKTLLGQ